MKKTRHTSTDHCVVLAYIVHGVTLIFSAILFHIKEPKCPEVCPFIYAPVCGSNGQTYPSNCSLEVIACKTGQDIKFVHNGPCGK